ncbi:hypothetical protein [Anoxybacillus suryakundensis]|uniref:Uncharacterized protein n=1 Tax=Anoxybacillus suryakundensis TaxID=1325335 RepID=A0A0K6GQB0_9BACL|nr:hypothetical protein [Anoxybacillus suryakundensis]CUA80802.1 hypothetical protein Ga0061060_11523 [Anoxybacillus suryakundensis]
MKKWLIISLSIVVLLLGGAGSYYYFLTNKKVDLKKEDEKVAEIVEEEYEILLPDDNGSTQSEKAQQTPSTKQNDTNQTSSNQTHLNKTNEPSSSPNEKATNHQGETNKQNNTTGQTVKTEQDGTNTSNKPVEQITVASIKEKYRPSFEHLQQQANAKIDALVDHAIAEYRERKESGQSVSFNYFFAKYNTAAQELEAKTDAAFNIIYSALENELKKNGFSPSHAKEFRETYEQQKSAQRNTLLKKALSKL